jgi:HlyD family secretion protein
MSSRQAAEMDVVTNNRRVKVVALVVVAGAVAATGAWWGFLRAVDKVAEGDVATVIRGPLRVTVTEAGEIEAASKTVISNELRSPATIKSVVPDGTFVTKGMKVIEFDCPELEDMMVKQTAVVDSAASTLTAAQKNLELKKAEMAEKTRKALDALNDANEDLKRYKEGEWPVKQDKADSDIQLAERDLRLAQEKLNFKLKVNQEMKEDCPYSANDIEAEKLGVQRLELASKSKIAEKEMLVKYDHPKSLRKLEGAVRDAELALKRARLEEEIQVGLAKADVDDKERTDKMAKSELQREKDEYAKRIYIAESDGLVVYDTGWSRYGGEPVIIAEGKKINSRQQLMIIPNMETLRVKTKVYEAMIDQVRLHQQAYVRLEAKPDVVLTGDVEMVAALASKQDAWMNPDIRYYDVFIKLDKKMEGLKPNMTAKVEIVLGELLDVLQIPVAAVFTDHEETYCWQVVDGRPQRTPVKIGRMSVSMAEVLSGLTDGGKVLLAPPEGAPRGKGLRSTAASSPSLNGAASAPGGTSQGATRPAAETGPGPAREAPAPGPSSRQDRRDRPPGERRSPGGRPGPG